MSEKQELGIQDASPSTVDDTVGKRDKNYRRYASTVDRALALFDTVLQEWADYISFLSRLSKALQARPIDVHEIPNAPLVARRLAQCLSPLLPPGVHQKTLEVYGTIFSILDRDGLSQSLGLYLPGLSPLLAYASLVVKPHLLSLFDKYICPLEPRQLKPALKSIILSLTPGLEDENSEEYETTHALLDKFKQKFREQKDSTSDSNEADDRFFWQCLFLSAITSPNKRQGVLTYLDRNLPAMTMSPIATMSSRSQVSGSPQDDKPLLPTDYQAVLLPEPGLLIRCFVTGLQDNQLLIQRGFLELLVTRLPLNSIVLRQKVAANDVQLLMSAASSVVARREMSLNRRLWTWLLGSNASTGVSDHVTMSSPDRRDSADAQINVVLPKPYFEMYGLSFLQDSLVSMFDDRSQSALVRSRPFRISLSLMDRAEIGEPLIPPIFKAAMLSVHSYEQTATAVESFQEVLRSANVFFDAIQSRAIWKEMIKLLAGLHPSSNMNDRRVIQITQAQTDIDLVHFIVANFNIQDEEMSTTHMPRAISYLLNSLYIWELNDDAAQSADIAPMLLKAYELVSYLLDLMPAIPTSKSRQYQTDKDQSIHPRHVEAFGARIKLDAINQFYTRDDSTETCSMDDETFTSEVISILSLITVLTLQGNDFGPSLRAKTSILTKALKKFDDPYLLDVELLLAAVEKSTGSDITKDSTCQSISQCISLASILELVYDVTTEDHWNKHVQIRSIITQLIVWLWSYVSPVDPQHNVEAIRCMWTIHQISFDDQLIEGIITSLLLTRGDYGMSRISMQSVRRFTTIWMHSISTVRPNHLEHSEVVNHSDRKSEKFKFHPDILAAPLLLCLDEIDGSESELTDYLQNWVGTMVDFYPILDLLIRRLRASNLPLLAHREKNQTQGQTTDNDDDQIDAEETLYFLRCVKNLLHLDTANIRSTILLPSSFQKSGSGDIKLSLSPLEPMQSDTSILSTNGDLLLHYCRLLITERSNAENTSHVSDALFGTALSTLPLLLRHVESSASVLTKTEMFLNERLRLMVAQGHTREQVRIMSCLDYFLDKRSLPRADPLPSQVNRDVHTHVKSTSKIALTQDKIEQPSDPSVASQVAIFDCILLALGRDESLVNIDHWVRLLEKSLPFIVPFLFPKLLDVTMSILKGIESIHDSIRAAFHKSNAVHPLIIEPIPALNSLYDALEAVLSQAHSQVISGEKASTSLKSPEQAQGFFGSMVSSSGNDTQTTKNAVANNQLLVFLCFKDAVKTAFKTWSWQDEENDSVSREIISPASFSYVSVRVRHRSRRILENLFAAEPLECLESLIEIANNSRHDLKIALRLLHDLQSTLPKHCVPALFNAIYSRTNPTVLDASRRSSLTSDLSDIQFASFLVAYTVSMDDDALEEIWDDCIIFLKDVLSNPLPHRHALPLLLEFLAALGQKIDRTNFGEQRRMRREIGDLFIRLLSAMFTIKPLVFSQDSQLRASLTAPELSPNKKVAGLRKSVLLTDDVVSIIANVLPKMHSILVEADRITAALSTISVQVLSPSFHSKGFPHSVSSHTLQLLVGMSRMPEATKTWKKDVLEAFNNSRFFDQSSMLLYESGWQPVLRHLGMIDKDRMPELISRLIAPASAGIMFGVGAHSARLEADGRHQLNLRRIAVLVLAAEKDTYMVSIGLLQDKLSELLSATASSSPSSATRADIYMVLRALVLKTSPAHLSPLWPAISGELYEALRSIGNIAGRDTYSISAILHAAKLLDTLLLIAPEEFQLREWLYITDTIDAVHKPAGWVPTALIDRLAEGFSDTTLNTTSTSNYSKPTDTGHRKLILQWEHIHGIAREDLMDHVIRPFLRHLSISAYESTYNLENPDMEACFVELQKDIFDESTLV